MSAVRWTPGAARKELHMLQGIDLIPHVSTFVDGEKQHPEAVAELKRLGAAYAETGGVVAVSPHFYSADSFPINPGDPLEESSEGVGVEDVAAAGQRRWDGLPFLADTLQRAARNRGVPTVLRGGPIDPGIWLPLRWMFPPETAMTVLPVGLSGLGPRNHYRMGLAIRDAAVAAPKPIVVLVSANLTNRPDLAYKRKTLLPEGRAVDQAILAGLTASDWGAYEGLAKETVEAARPDGGENMLWLLRGLSSGLRGDVRYYGHAHGAYGMALVHFETEALNAA
jgi:aromatic ring-opening dioxygenase catalytic subunit (LigB family)